MSVSKDGRWPFHAAYLAPSAERCSAGSRSPTIWPRPRVGCSIVFRPAGKTPAVCQTGFPNLAVPVIGLAYNPNDNLLLALASGEGRVTLDGGDLPLAMTNQVTLMPKNTIIVAPPDNDKLALTMTQKTGAISGSFANPSNPKQPIRINGILLRTKPTRPAISQGPIRAEHSCLKPREPYTTGKLEPTHE